MVIADRNTGRRRKAAAAKSTLRIKREDAAGRPLPKRRAAAGAGKGNGPDSAAADDVEITGLDLKPAPLSPAMQAYFAKCEEKLGFVPNVLKAYAFDMAKLEAFVAMYNDLMLGASGLSKLEREMIAVVVSACNQCLYWLVAHAAAVRGLSGDP